MSDIGKQKTGGQSITSVVSDFYFRNLVRWRFIMGTCWWCHWGWPKKIREIYDDAVERLNGDNSALHWGPAHIVWEDENWDSAQWCLDNFEKYADREQYSDQELSVVRESLQRLLTVPDEFKHEPAGYDGKNPSSYPPPSHWEMQRV